MATATKKPAAAKPKLSRWAQLVKEAKKDYKPTAPYVLDAVDPPILITAPDGLERSLALATLTDKAGSVAVNDLAPMVEALVGMDVFPDVWALIRNEPVDVTIALVRDINDHFNGGSDDGAGDLPGGELDS